MILRIVCTLANKCEEEKEHSCGPRRTDFIFSLLVGSTCKCQLRKDPSCTKTGSGCSGDGGIFHIDFLENKIVEFDEKARSVTRPKLKCYGVSK